MIPGYKVERVLGTGAHGKVYLAREEGGLERPVALKVFEKKDEFERELAMTRRVEELRRSRRVAEIVQSLGSGEHGGLSYIVLEYIESGSLADLVAASGPLEVERAVGFTRDAGRALAFLHGEGIFHRDVKPQNLLLGQDGRVRLGDFGLSRSLAGTLSAAGSPAFAAPEVIAGRVADGRRADIYSLGATLAFLLTGETVLPGRPDVFSLERRGVPRGLQQAIASACAADPAERPGSVEELLSSLDTKIPETPRSESGSPDGGAGGLNMRTDFDAPPVTEPRLAKRAIASFICALLVWPMTIPILLALFTVRESGPEDTSKAEGGVSVFTTVVLIVVALTPLVLEVLAFVFGAQARSRIAASRGALTGSGWALAGIIIGALNLLPMCLAIPASLALGRASAAREGASARIVHDHKSFVMLSYYKRKEVILPVIAALRAQGEDPRDFYVEDDLEPKVEGNELVVPLWHESSFDESNTGVVGNPGGKCRNAYVDRKTNQVRFAAWQ